MYYIEEHTYSIETVPDNAWWPHDRVPTTYSDMIDAKVARDLRIRSEIQQAHDKMHALSQRVIVLQRLLGS